LHRAETGVLLVDDGTGDIDLEALKAVLKLVSAVEKEG
jgi:ABC-type lipoprotein export system ATPase subunit